MTPDPLLVCDRTREPSNALAGLLAGRAAFLVAGGPSAASLPLNRLYLRGCWSLAVNNMAGHAGYRPQAFVCADPPCKFSHGIWLDPGVMKFIPIPKFLGKRAALRRKLATGEFVDLPGGVNAMPNVWGFSRRSWLLPDDSFFETPDAAWGNHAAGVLRTGQPKTVCTMLLGLRLLRYLGASRIYLVGVDFHMRPNAGYVFDQERNADACTNNNDQFRVVGSWLDTMQASGVFERAGVAVYNCNRESSLTAFPHMPFLEAVQDATGDIQEPLDLSGWYEK